MHDTVILCSWESLVSTATTRGSRWVPLDLSISGTRSAEGEELAEEHFGDATQFAILLTGPAAEIERQGPPLVRELRSDPAATGIPPWDRGTVTALRPGPRRALIIVDYQVPLATAMRDTVPQLERIVAERVRPPLTAVASRTASAQARTRSANGL